MSLGARRCPPAGPLPRGAVVQMGRRPGAAIPHTHPAPLFFLCLLLRRCPDEPRLCRVEHVEREEPSAQDEAGGRAIGRHACGSPCSSPRFKSSSSSRMFPWGCAGPTGTVFPASSGTSVCDVNGRVEAELPDLPGICLVLE